MIGGLRGPLRTHRLAHAIGSRSSATFPTQALPTTPPGSSRLAPTSGGVRRQLGHTTIAQTSDTYGHLESERHEARVNLDEVLTPRRRPAASIYVPPSPPEPRPSAQLLRIMEGEMMVEGKEFVGHAFNNCALLARPSCKTRQATQPGATASKRATGRHSRRSGARRLVFPVTGRSGNDGTAHDRPNGYPRLF